VNCGAHCCRWIIVCIVMLIWGNGAFKTWANSIFVWNYRSLICTT
jgi:hypothetical protein